MKKIGKIVLWTVILALFCGTFFYLWYSSREKTAVYELVSPSMTNVERTTVLTGKIEPRDEIDIKPQISGIISEVLVEAGDEVKEGDVLAKIKVVPEESQLSSAESRVEVNKIALERARQKYERTKALYEKKYESRETYETDYASYEQARRELEQAEDQLMIVREGVSSGNAQSSNTLVRATVSGLVLEVPIKVGSSVIQANTMNDGTTIAKIADMSDLLFKGKIDETEVDLLREGMPVRITVGAVEGSDYGAIIEKIAPMATEDNGTNTFEVKAALSTDEAQNMRAGYSANATVILEAANNVLVVPERVIEYAGDSAFVYVLTDTVPNQKFERKAIKTGISNGLDAQLLSDGLTTTSRLRGNQITK